MVVDHRRKKKKRERERKVVWDHYRKKIIKNKNKDVGLVMTTLRVC